MEAEHFLKLLEDNGFDFFTGVPCSYFNSFTLLLDEKPDDIHVPAGREDIAVGLSVGAYLGGRLPLIYMQNSGLGNSLEAFASLHMIYKIPSLVLVTYRGPLDRGWEEHRVMGKSTEGILKACNFNYSIMEDNTLENNISNDEITRISNHIKKTQLPWFLLIWKDAIQ